MKSLFLGRPFALAVTLAWLCASIAAAELKYTDMEQRLGSLAKKNSIVSHVEPASFLQDTELPLGKPIEVQAPRELADPGGLQNGCDTCEVGRTCDKCRSQPMHGVYYTQVEVLWMRAHINEGAVGKLSEKYELSPRFVIGYEDAGGVGTRVRYWTYGRQSSNLNSPADAVRFELDVLDLEATSRFGNERSELVIAGGMRWADFDIIIDDEQVSADLPGITFAADLRTILCRGCNWEWANLAGARWSLLGGDWEGSGTGFLEPYRDDNLTVTEIYGGVEYVQHYSGYDIYARLVFEVQNWHSDVAAQTAGTDSIGFVGPGVHLGMNF